MSSGPQMTILGERLCWREEGVLGDRSCPRLPAVVHCRNCSEYSRIGRLLFEREAPPDLARETAETLASPEQEAAGESLSLFVFRLGTELFALKTTLLQEVTAPLPVHRVPFRSGTVFLGLVNVNGELLPCVSAAAALGLENSPEGAFRPRLVVVGRAGNRFAFQVDEAIAIRRVPLADLQSPPATVANAPAAKSSSVFRVDGTEVAVIDETRVLETVSRSLNP
jgi:chemotaxis-related protein WspD